MKITFFENGNNMAFENGKQVPECQKGWLEVFCNYLKSIGYEPTNIDFELPNRRKAKIYKTDNGYNWSIY